MLAKDGPLPRRYFDHPLGGEWNDHRDCHIRPDLVLIYRNPGAASLNSFREATSPDIGASPSAPTGGLSGAMTEPTPWTWN